MAIQERMSLRNLYLYLVCLVTLVITLFAAVSLVRSTVSLLYPDPGYYGFAVGEDPGLSEEERARHEEVAEESQRRQAVLELVGSATTLIIAGPLYVYHWRRVQSELPDHAARTPSADAGTP